MPGPRFVELIRVSSAGQAARETPEDQRRALDALRRSRPGTLVERIEQQVSGAAAGQDRPDLIRLFDLAAARAFDEVRVRHLDRLTRHEDPLERAAVLSVVRRAGAVIVDAGGAVLDPATMGGELTWVVATLASAEERRKILERTMAAKRRLASEGRLASGPRCVPWGRAFDRQRGAWELTEAAATYRSLFDLALAGETLNGIAATLNRDGAPSPRGRPWTAQMVGNLLRAKHAAGTWRSYGSEIQIPPIVSAETQAAVRERLRAHDNAGGPHVRYPALLRKIAVCGVCGAALHTNRNSSRYAQPYYHCSGEDRRCYRAHNIAAVDDAVRSRLAAWLARPGAVASLEGDPGGEDPAAAVSEAEKRVKAACAAEVRDARRALAAGYSAETLRELAADSRAKVDAAELELAHARERVRFIERRAEIVAGLEDLAARLRAGLGASRFEDWRRLVELLFPRGSVALWPDGRIRLRGAVALDEAGEEAVRTAGKAARRSRTSCSVPVTLEARVAVR